MDLSHRIRQDEAPSGLETGGGAFASGDDDDGGVDRRASGDGYAGLSEPSLISAGGSWAKSKQYQELPTLHSSLVHECPGDLCTLCAEGLQSNGREPLPARIQTIMAQYPRKRLRVLHAEVERELLWGGIGRVSQAFYHLAEDGTFEDLQLLLPETKSGTG